MIYVLPPPLLYLRFTPGPLHPGGLKDDTFGDGTAGVPPGAVCLVLGGSVVGACRCVRAAHGSDLLLQVRCLMRGDQHVLGCWTDQRLARPSNKPLQQALTTGFLQVASESGAAVGSRDRGAPISHVDAEFTRQRLLVMANIAAGAQGRGAASSSAPAPTEGLTLSTRGRRGGQSQLRGRPGDMVLLAMGAGAGLGSGSDSPCSDATTAPACSLVVTEQGEECTFCKAEAYGQCVSCDSVTSMQGNVRPRAAPCTSPGRPALT